VRERRLDIFVYYWYSSSLKKKKKKSIRGLHRPEIRERDTTANDTMMCSKNKKFAQK
jgi:hypothetical protein